MKFSRFRKNLKFFNQTKKISSENDRKLAISVQNQNLGFKKNNKIVLHHLKIKKKSKISKKK